MKNLGIKIFSLLTGSFDTKPIPTMMSVLVFLSAILGVVYYNQNKENTEHRDNEILNCKIENDSLKFKILQMKDEQIKELKEIKETVRTKKLKK